MSLLIKSVSSNCGTRVQVRAMGVPGDWNSCQYDGGSYYAKKW